MYERTHEGLVDAPYTKLEEEGADNHWAPRNRHRRRHTKLRCLVLGTAALLVVGVLVASLVTIFGGRSEQQGSSNVDDVQVDVSKLATSGTERIVKGRSKKTGPPGKQLNASGGTNGMLSLRERSGQFASIEFPALGKGEFANFQRDVAETRTSNSRPEPSFGRTARRNPKTIVLDAFPFRHADFKQRSQLIGRIRKKSAALPPVAVGNTLENEANKDLSQLDWKDTDKRRQESSNPGYEEETLEAEK